jgi:hypothetical protein
MFREKVVLKRSQIIPHAVVRIDSDDWGNIPNGKACGRSIIREKPRRETRIEDAHLTTYPADWAS